MKFYTHLSSDTLPDLHWTVNSEWNHTYKRATNTCMAPTYTCSATKTFTHVHMEFIVVAGTHLQNNKKKNKQQRATLQHGLMYVWSYNPRYYGISTTISNSSVYFCACFCFLLILSIFFFFRMLLTICNMNISFLILLRFDSR